MYDFYLIHFYEKKDNYFMKNIGIVITNITEIGGTERAVTNLSNILSKKYNVFVISVDSKEGNCKYQLNESVKIIHLGLNIENKNLLNKFIEYKKLLKKIKCFTKKYNSDYLIGTLLMFNCLISKIKSVKTIGCEHFNYQNANKIHKILRKKCYKKLNAVVLLTQKDKENYNFLNNTYVIPNSLSFITEKKSDCQKKEMISVGRLAKQKGFDYLLEIAKILKIKLPDWHISIYGEGPEKENLERNIKENSLTDFVQIKEPTQDIINVYLNSSVYLSTSRWEGLPMVLIEAQHCGLPAVAFDCNYGPSDIIINNKTGFLCKCFDTKNFANKVIELCSDDKKLLSFGKEASKNSLRFSTNHIELEWNTLLENL